MGGGGGGGTTTVSGIDAEFKPDIQTGLGISRALLEQQQADPSKVVAGLTQQQADALNAQTALAQQKIMGTGMYDTRAAEQGSLLGLMGQNLGNAQAAGNLGSARSQKALASALAGRAGEYQKQRQTFADEGIADLGSAGTTLQKQAQAELEARDTSLDRFFSRLSGAAPRSTTTTGGGK
jgi:hypothetical protein